MAKTVFLLPEICGLGRERMQHSTISDRHTSGQTGRPEDISLPVFHNIRQTYKRTDRQAGRHLTPCVPQYQTDIQADRQAGRKTFHSLCSTISDRHTSGQTGRPEDISLPVFHNIRQTYKRTDRQAGRHFTPCVSQFCVSVYGMEFVG